ncbi:MAG: hypothetical protein ACK42L_09015 [Thermoanaerobaculum sp.]
MCVLVAGAVFAAAPASAYVACVSTDDGCNFSLTCRAYDDRTHKELEGFDFHIEYYYC